MKIYCSEIMPVAVCWQNYSGNDKRC